MRKSLWIVLALILAGGATVARADSITLSFVGPTTVVLGGVVPTDVLQGTDAMGLALAFLVFSDSNPGAITFAIMGNNGPNEEVILEPMSPGTAIVEFEAVNEVGDSAFVTEDFCVVSSPGQTCSTGAVPEPSSVALMLLGVGLVLGLRKRNSRGHQLAA